MPSPVPGALHSVLVYSSIYELRMMRFCWWANTFRKLIYFSNITVLNVVTYENAVLSALTSRALNYSPHCLTHSVNKGPRAGLRVPSLCGCRAFSLASAFTLNHSGLPRFLNMDSSPTPHFLQIIPPSATALNINQTLIVF